MKTFVYFAIGFAVLALGCGYWLIFIHDAHDYKRQLSQEDRHAEVVGAKPLPQAPLKITIRPRRASCISIDKAEFDGDTFITYISNKCNVSFQFVHVGYKQYAPDRTIIESDDEYAVAGVDLGPGERVEYTFNSYRYHPDPRAVELVVSAWADR